MKPQPQGPFYMNKNRKRVMKEYRKQCKKSGYFPTAGYKKKKKPFPKFD